MSIDISQFHQVFFDEAEEHLATMESHLLELDVEAPNLDDLNAIFRAAHSIKGGSGTFGFRDMTEVTHILETLLDRLRKSELRPTVEMVDTFLSAVDILKSQLNGHRAGGEVDEHEVKAVCEALTRLSENDQPAAAEAGTASSTGPSISTHSVHYRITLNNTGSSLDALMEDLGNIGTLSAFVRDEDKASMALTTSLKEAELLEIFSFFVQSEDVSISPDPVNCEEAYGFFDDAPLSIPTEPQAYGFFDEDEATATANATTSANESYGLFVSEAELQAQQEQAQGYGFFEKTTPVVAPQPEPKPATPSKKAEAKVAAAGSSDTSSIRVSVEKVDQLINLVGELVITQAMLAQTASEIDPVLQEKLLDGVSLLERNTRDLQEAVMSIRMMPMNFVFSRFPRMVRDLASKLNKEINFRTEGEGTELDKGLIEKITDPLTHLVRNSLDHGIESPQARIERGKDPRGNLVLRAFHQGGNVVIEVQDDGAGLSREKILGKARERGLNVSEGMPDQEVWQLIFAPGFSTAEQVTDVSGRGVGMDVVKRNIESLGGRVDIDSVQFAGTKITIRLPLTLAILDGLSIAVGDETFIVPLTSIIESLQPAAEDIKTIAGQGRVVQVRGEYLPLVTLHDVFDVIPRSYDPHKGTLMIVEGDGIKGAMLVDELMGQQQVVIKSLESNYRKVPGVSGATILGDGRVALILDITAILRIGKSIPPKVTTIVGELDTASVSRSVAA